MRRPKPNARPHGQLRQSQAVTTFGPGSLLDLPDYSVLVGGLDTWWPRGAEIDEPRLVEKLQRDLKIPELRLHAPPPYQEPPATPSGIAVYQFPEWFVTQRAETRAGGADRSRLLIHRQSLIRGKYVDRDKVRMFLNVERRRTDTSLDSEVIKRFLHRFRTKEWPGTRLPELFYDPRSLDSDPARRASLHAKCVVVDEEVALVSSANFTEAAQQRNVEAGVLIRSHRFAEKLSAHFRALTEAGHFRRIE